MTGSPSTIVPDQGGRGAGTATLAIRIAAVAAAYLIAAAVGLSLDAVAGFATLVWPASGIALAAIMLGGFRLWPAITLGAYIANQLAGAPAPTALAIAIGNTGEALVAAYLLRQDPDFRVSLDRPRDVLALIILASGVATTVSATVGVGSLYLSGIVAVPNVEETWRAWWVGDMIGDLLVAPLILVWANSRSIRPNRVGAAEASLLALGIVVATIVVFGMPGSSADATRGREYLLFPPLIWAALRFGVRGAVTAVVAVATIAVTQTALGRGPFIRPELHQSLLALQTFMGVSGATFLILGASSSEKRRTEAQLRTAQETAEEANRAKAGFLAVVSHELRTPLNAISGYLDMLSMELDGPLTPKQRSSVERMSQSQRHLLSLIEDVLGFAQTEAGRRSFSIRPVRVRDAMEAIESIVVAEVTKKGLKLELLAEADPHVLADPDKLRQVLLNLVTNAMKFTPPGGAITVFAERTGDQVRISVADTGIGIPREQLHRVFDPFYQVEQGDTRRYPGIGLGLSIVRDAVRAMEGEVGIESEQ
ncbi:MAG TPA: MASE1 domain-containing protein, partial [Gemmatimonadaceae bacterium]|nr:MASE1 domain-containing protein [Gemmatimonadaceae bacterium]